VGAPGVGGRRQPLLTRESSEIVHPQDLGEPDEQRQPRRQQTIGLHSLDPLCGPSDQATEDGTGHPSTLAEVPDALAGAHAVELVHGAHRSTPSVL
jgi:hypothetical protein